MKLITKTSLNFLSISLFIFLIGIVVFYYLLRNQVDDNINNELYKRKTSIQNELYSLRAPSNLSPSENEKITYEIAKPNTKEFVQYIDTIIYSQSQKKYIPYRKIKFTTKVNEHTTIVSIYKSLAETDSLIIRISLIMTILVIVIIAIMLFLNIYSSKNAWAVFYNTIEKISTYSISENQDFNLQKSDIKEFEQLNSVLSEMHNRIQKDYLNLKEYTENTSHEIQTPLAIVAAKLELLLQSDELKQQQIKLVNDAYMASNRLSKLNKSLILLAKIENRQFHHEENINISELIEKQIDLFEDMISAQNIKINKNCIENISLMMNPYLAETLILNLLKNAIRHNTKNGEIDIKFANQYITFSNTGATNSLNKNEIFNRFSKNSNSTESIGLGLSIIKKICDLYKYTIDYSYKEKRHCFTIILK